MNLKLTSIVLSLGAAVLTNVACTNGTADDASAAENDVTSSRQDLVGAFQAAGGAGRPPTFDGLVLAADGSFFADVDTGIRCVRAPCPSNVRLTGRYSTSGDVLELEATPGAKASSFYGRYEYSLSGSKLTLSRADGWSNDLVKAPSYCSEAADCQAQGIVHPMCVGQWACGAEAASHTCSYECGVDPVDDSVWPPDATKLVARNAGGGFTPQPAPGSECGLGQATYTLDTATKTVSYETCKFVDWQTPLKKETGDKALSDAEMAKVDAAMKAVAVSKQDLCGADKPFLSLTVTSPSRGTKEYKDSFYSCMGEGTYVDGIDGVLGALRDVVGN